MRRLSGRHYAWIAASVYIWAVIVTVTSVAEYPAPDFPASLPGLQIPKELTLILAVAFLLVALAVNLSRHKRTSPELLEDRPRPPINPG